MKKFTFSVLSLVLAIIFTFGFAACNMDNKGDDEGNNKGGNKVDKPAAPVTYTLDNIVYSVSGMDDYYVDINNMSETDRQNFESVINMYGRTVKISKSDIEFVDGTVLSAMGNSEYTLSGNDVLLKNETMASVFNYVKLKDGVFSLGISQQVGSYTSTTMLNYKSANASVGGTGEEPPSLADGVLNVGDIFSARIEKRVDWSDDEKALFIIEGNYSSEDYSENQIETLLTEYYFDIQKNLHAVTGSNEGMWTSYSPEVAEITLDNTGSTRKFTIAYDITEYATYYYTPHFGNAYDSYQGKVAPKNITLNSRFEEEFVIGYKRYKIISVPGSYLSTEFWGSVGIIIENVFSPMDYYSLEMYQRKPCLCLGFNYVCEPKEFNNSTYQAEDFLCSALENFYIDVENDPESDMGWSRVATPTIEDGTVIPRVEEGEDGLFHFKVFIDLSAARAGQRLYFHLSMDGEEGINFKRFGLDEHGYYVYTNNNLWYYVDDEIDSDWRNGLIMILVKKIPT